MKIAETATAGAIAGAMLAAGEAFWLAATIPSALAPIGGAWGLFLTVLPRALLVAGAAGVIQGLGLLAVGHAARALARWRGRQETWFAGIAAVAGVIAFSVLAHLLLGGRGARSIVQHPILLAGLGAAVAWCSFEVTRLAVRAPSWIRETEARSWTARGLRALVVGGPLALACTLYLGDRLILVRLYHPFHAALRIGMFTALLTSLLLGWRLVFEAPRRSRASVAAALAILTVAMALESHERSRPVYAAASNLMRLHGAVGGALVGVADSVVDRKAARQPPIGSSSVSNVRGGPRGAREPIAPGANILFITIDALRADHLETYGYARPTSPNLSKLAGQSVVFEHAYTSAPHTSFAITSLLTGHPSMALADRGVLDGTPTLADRARANGYRTAAFFPPAVFFVEGERFKSFEKRSFGFEFALADDLSETTSAALQTDRVLAYLADRSPERFLIWAHYFAPHEPYVEHPEDGPSFGKTAIDRYDSEIRWVDRHIGRLVRGVRSGHPNTVVIVTADHGEEFGDHGGAYHGTTLYDEQVRVPLILSVPGLAPRRFPAPVSTTSIVPTLLGIVGVPGDESLDGVDLGPWLAPGGLPEDRPPDPVFAENPGQRMVAWGQDKLICDTRTDGCVLIDLSRDPRELVDTSLARPARFATLRATMDTWIARQDELGGRTSLWARVADRSAPPETRRTAARSIARLPDPSRLPELRSAWGEEEDATVKAWLAVALGELGDRAARAALPSLVDAAEDRDDELRARGALARAGLQDDSAVTELAETLPRVSDVNLRCALMQALAKLGTPLAASTLVSEYDVVRSRICCATALSTLRDPSTLPFMLERLPDEPYTIVQTALVRALGLIGDRRAIPVLQSIRAATPEVELVQAIDAALTEMKPAPSGT